MSRLRHRAPSARRAELLQAVKKPIPEGYGLAPVNRWQRRQMAKALKRAARPKPQS